jgi:hypothetical protein
MAIVSINYPSIAACEAAPGAAGFDAGSTAVIGTSNFTLEVSSAAIDHTTVLDAKIGGIRWLISANPATSISGLTGDVTATGPGSAAATVANIPTTATMAGKVTATAIAAPSTPASGKGAIYVDSTSKNLAVKDDAGVVKHGVQSMTTANKIVTAISDAGAVSTVDNTWFDQQKAFLISKVSQLTGFGYIKCGQYGLGAAVASTFTNAAAIEGGAIGNPASGAVTFGGPVFQNCQTGKFGIAFRGKLAVTITGSFAEIGIINSAASRHGGVMSQFDTDATHYCLSLAASNTATSVVNDGGIHDFALTSDGTTLTLWIDGASATTRATSGVTAEALAPMVNGTTAGQAAAMQVCYGYVAP